MGRTRKSLVLKRRNLVRRLYLKGFQTAEEIRQNPELVNKFGNVSKRVVQSDLREINKWYVAAVEKNPNILEKQAEYILKHLDQLKMVKTRLHEIADRAKARGKLKEEITACKAVVDELSHEARVLKLIDVTKTINNYIRIDKLGILVDGVTKVVRDFVPQDKQKTALERLKKISKDVVDEGSK